MFFIRRTLFITQNYSYLHFSLSHKSPSGVILKKCVLTITSTITYNSSKNLSKLFHIEQNFVAKFSLLYF